MELYLSSLRYRLDILALTETWSSTGFDNFQVPGYNHDCAFCASQRGGNVALYIAHYLHPVVKTEVTVISCYELLIIRVYEAIIAVCSPPTPPFTPVLSF